MCAGYIYILMNPAMPSVLKIGKTTRRCEQRATEISAGTGVPVPWHVAFEIPVGDCDLAEKKIHVALAKYRVETGKECFVVPLKKAVTLLMDIALEFPFMAADADPHNSFSDRTPNLRQRASNGDSTAQKSLAEEYDRQEDFVHARKWYVEAAKNGSKEVFDRLGEMYFHGLGGPRQFAHAHACFCVSFFHRQGKGGAPHPLISVTERHPQFSKIEAEGYRHVMMSWAKPEKDMDSPKQG